VAEASRDDAGGPRHPVGDLRLVHFDDRAVQLAQALDIPLSELFRAESEAPTDDGYYRRLVEFARSAHLSRKQVEQLIAVGRAMFDAGEPVKARLEIKTPPSRRCAIPGCGRPLLARGLCPSHYRRKLRQSRQA
jgi:hypothetical protein